VKKDDWMNELADGIVRENWPLHTILIYVAALLEPKGGSMKKDKKANYVQVGEPQKGISSTITYTGQPDWEKEFEKKFSGKGFLGMSGPWHKDDVKDFIRSVLKQERLRTLEEVKRQLKHYSVVCPESSRCADYTPEQFIDMLVSKEEEDGKDKH